MRMIPNTIAFLILGAVGIFGMPSSSVLDSAAVIRPEDRQIIESISQELWKKAEFALVVLTTKDIGDVAIEEYANSMYEVLGIGSKEKEEGALVVLAMKQRKARIEVGYGSEGYINDARAGRILDSYGVPHFSANNFSTGLVAVAAGIAQVVSKEKGIEDQILGKGLEESYTEEKLSLLQIIGIGVLLILLLGTRPGRMLLFWFLITGGGRNNGGGGFGGRMGGGGFGGGFGGFGGGRSGGGGASRGF